MSKMQGKKTVCPSCGSDKILQVREDLNKCMLCKLYFDAEGLPPKLKVFPSAIQVKELAAKQEIETLELNPDMVTFVNRVAERLAPLTGLDENAKARALKIQREIRRELTEVFQGKADFNKWYDRAKTNFGLHHQTFTSILYESLEGLQSPEARELQQQYAQTLAKMRQA